MQAGSQHQNHIAQPPKEEQTQKKVNESAFMIKKSYFQKKIRKIHFKIQTVTSKQMKKYFKFQRKSEFDVLVVLVKGFGIPFDFCNQQYSSHRILGSCYQKDSKLILKNHQFGSFSKIVFSDCSKLKLPLVLVIYAHRTLKNKELNYFFDLDCFQVKGKILQVFRFIQNMAKLVQIVQYFQSQACYLTIKIEQSQQKLKQKIIQQFSLKNKHVNATNFLEDSSCLKTFKSHPQSELIAIFNPQLHGANMKIREEEQKQFFLNLQVYEGLAALLQQNLNFSKEEIYKNEICLRIQAFYFNQLIKAKQKCLSFTAISTLHQKLIPQLIIELQNYKNTQKPMQINHLSHIPVRFKKFHLKCYGCKTKRVRVTCYGCSKLEGKVIPLCFTCFPKYHINIITSIPSTRSKKNEQMDQNLEKEEALFQKWTNLEQQVLKIIEEETPKQCKKEETA